MFSAAWVLPEGKQVAKPGGRNADTEHDAEDTETKTDTKTSNKK